MDEGWILRDLLEVQSPSGDERAAGIVFAEHARLLGFRTRIDSVGNVHATIGLGRPHTMFLGHIDTVPGFWPVKQEGDSLMGRGAVDAKGSLVAGLVAASRVGADTTGTRIVVASVGEESDSRGALELLRHPPPDALVVGEPSGWDAVAIGFRGRRTGVYRSRRIASHASAPWLGALDEAAVVAVRVRAFVAEQAGRGLFESCSSRLVRWEHRVDGLEESTEFDVDVRGPPGFDWGSLDRIDPCLRWSDPVEAVVVPKGNAVVRALVEGIRVSGGRPRYLLKGGTSDLNYAAKAWRIPMASYGPGDPNLDHTPHERLSLEELSRATDVLSTVFRRLSRMPEARASPRAKPLSR